MNKHNSRREHNDYNNHKSQKEIGASTESQPNGNRYKQLYAD